MLMMEIAIRCRCLRLYTCSDTLAQLPGLLQQFQSTRAITATLKEVGLLKAGEKQPIKLLSDGEITKRLTVTVDRASAQARAKIEAAGGSIEETLPRKNAVASGEEA